MNTPSSTTTTTPRRIVILGAGFGGFYTAHHLEKLLRKRPDTEITLLSQNNYFLMTPLLFEAGSGVLEPRHAVNPLRKMLKKSRFVEATVERIDLHARKIYATHQPNNFAYELDYDHLVLALGGVTNRSLIPGSQHALGFKTLADAIFLRNHIIDLFEQADVEQNPQRQKKLLTLIIIGGGLVGVELMGELTEFIDNLLTSYPRIPKNIIRFVLVEALPNILPEMQKSLADYAANVLRHRGVQLLLNTKVEKIEPDRIFLPLPSPDNIIESNTILLAAGLGPNPLLHDLPLDKAKNGRIIVQPTMRSPQFPEVWALGDCAAIPDKDGKPYPPLAQHALREAKVLARNIATVLTHAPSTPEPPLKPFLYQSLGTLASLGHYDGVARLLTFKIKGLPAWWIWRTYYVMQMPRWERRLRIIIDWTIALFFKNDAVKLDLFGEQHPSNQPLPKNTPIEHIRQTPDGGSPPPKT